MSKNINQVYTDNPITTNAGTDLMYFGQSPYGAGDDAAMLFSDFEAQFSSGGARFGTATNIGDAYSVTLTPPITSYEDGFTINIFTSNANATSSPTLEIDGLGAIPILNATQIIIGTGDFGGSAAIAQCIYNATTNAFLLQNPQSSQWANLGYQAGYLDVVYDTGVADAYVGVGDQFKTVDADGFFAQGYCIKLYPGNDNTGACTFNYADVGVKNIKLADGSDPAAGMMKATMASFLMYNGTVWQLINPFSASSSSPWTAGAGTGSAKGGDGTEVASGNYSVSYGSATNTASGLNAAAFGSGNTAAGDYSFACGQNCSTNVSQSWTFAGGYASVAEAPYSFAYGRGCDAYGSYAFALGHSAQAGGAHSFAWGYSVTASQAGSMILACGDGNGALNTAANQYGAYFAGGFAFGMYSADYSGLHDFVKIDTSGNLINIGGEADQSKSVQSPVTGDSITIAKYVRRLLLTPAGTLATLTVTMPAAPIDGQLITVSCSQVVTALTFSANAGQSILNAPTAFAAGQKVDYCYHLATTTWLVG